MLSLTDMISITTGTKVCQLRQHVGMVFQKPCIFPKSIYDNVLFGVRQLYRMKKAEHKEIVEETLKKVYLWGEVKDKLRRSALELSQGQQQRLTNCACFGSKAQGTFIR